MSDNNSSYTDPKTVVLQDEQHLVLDHDYDGIQELDNPLPRWWQIIFYGSIVFSAIYCAYYMLGPGPSLQDELVAQMKSIEALKPAPAQGGELTNEQLFAMLGDTTRLESGKGVYDGKCAVCHGAAGEGGIGPNLTDNFWIHGDGSPTGIVKVIHDGVAEKGMPPWGPVLTPDELTNVALYVRKFRGTKPAKPKEPQGQEYPAEDSQGAKI